MCLLLSFSLVKWSRASGFRVLQGLRVVLNVSVSFLQGLAGLGRVPFLEKWVWD